MTLTRADRLTILCLTAILVGATLAAVLSGRDVGPLVAVVEGPAVSGLIGLVLLRRTAAVHHQVESVDRNTNGKLSAVLARLEATGAGTAQMLSATSRASQEPKDQNVWPLTRLPPTAPAAGDDPAGRPR